MTNTNLTGPFGFWTFPILNTLINTFSSYPVLHIRKEGRNGWGGKIFKPIIGNTADNIAEKHSAIINEEQWNWTDYLGNKREITIYRKIVAK